MHRPLWRGQQPVLVWFPVATSPLSCWPIYCHSNFLGVQNAGLSPVQRTVVAISPTKITWKFRSFDYVLVDVKSIGEYRLAWCIVFGFTRNVYIYKKRIFYNTIRFSCFEVAQRVRYYIPNSLRQQPESDWQFFDFEKADSSESR